MTIALSLELRILTYSVILGVLQLLAAAQLGTGQRGVKWNMGPRDQKMPELTGFAGRMERTYKNFMETFVFFAAAILIVQAVGRNSGLSQAGAEIYLGARVIYVPLYILGVPAVRTGVWMLSLVGIGLVLAALL